MPTVLRVQGFVTKIHLNDHAPAHVHVLKAGGEAVVTLVPVMVLRVWRMSRSDAAAAKRVVEDNSAYLMSSWKGIHGDEGF
jgi:hypothetical protein